MVIFEVRVRYENIRGGHSQIREKFGSRKSENILVILL